jgi:hypothetical protein
VVVLGGNKLIVRLDRSIEIRATSAIIGRYLTNVSVTALLARGHIALASS